MSLFDPYNNNNAVQDYYAERQRYELEMAKQQHQAALTGNSLAGMLGMQQQAVRATPPKQDPQPNPVLLLTGEDE